MQSRLALRVIMLCILLLGGCATRETFYSNRFSEGKDGALSGISVDAKQRFVWMPTRPVRNLKSGTTSAYEYEVKDQKIICAEPSPDAASAFATSLSASLGVALSNVTVDASMARSVSETLHQLTQRTEMMQLLRDAYYRACEAYANGMVGEFGYGLLLNQIDNVMIKMTAINVVGEQRPLPESAQDRQKLGAAKVKETELAIAQDQLKAARDRLEKAEERLTVARKEKDAADAKVAGLKKEQEKIDKELEGSGLTDARKKELRDQSIKVEGALAAAEKTKSLTEESAGTATAAKTAAETEANQAKTALKTAQEALAAARNEAAAVAQPPFAPEALKAIEKIVTHTYGHSTVVGACLMWLSQHLEVAAAPQTSEPAIVGACRAFLRQVEGQTAQSVEEQAIVATFRKALEESMRRTTRSVIDHLDMNGERNSGGERE